MSTGRRSTLLACLIALAGCHEPEPEATDRVAVHVGLVGLDAHNAPVVVLEENEGPRLLRIWIGMSEAQSIAEQKEGRRPPRPNTHDLAERVIHGLAGEVVEVVVNDLRHGIYFATLALRVQGRLVEIDARPSDAIAIALRVDAPIYVHSALFDADEHGAFSAGPGQEIHGPPAGGARPRRSRPATGSLSL